MDAAILFISKLESMQNKQAKHAEHNVNYIKTGHIVCYNVSELVWKKHRLLFIF